MHVNIRVEKEIGRLRKHDELERRPPSEVRDVVVSFDTADSSILYIDIRYSIGETNDPRNLVFPFYVIPPEIT